jgi:hypothetical protein
MKLPACAPGAKAAAASIVAVSSTEIFLTLNIFTSSESY